MEGLVRQQRIHEVAERAGGIGEGESRHDIVLGGAMLEPAAEVDRPVDNVEEDGVLVVRRVHRSEEHTSELQSRVDLVCRLLLEKKKKISTGVFGLRKEKNTTYKEK